MGDIDLTETKSTFCGCCTREGDRKSTNKNILQCIPNNTDIKINKQTGAV